MKYTYFHLGIFCTILFLFTIGLLLFRWNGQRKVQQQLNILEQTVSRTSLPKIEKLPSIFRTGKETPHKDSPDFPISVKKEILPQYQKLYEENQDLIGWIEIPGTMLNFPVMYTPNDPTYYLYHLFDGTNSLYGMPFLDGDCSIEPRSTNLILHGHHMLDGTMFSTLLEYQDKNYFLSHPEIDFNTLYQEEKYAIISVFYWVYDEKDSSPDLYYNFIDAKDPADFDRFIALVKELSFYDTGVSASYGDELLTLITCWDYQGNGRMNIVAKKIEPCALPGLLDSKKAQKTE
ncbi:MAG: class B sortase [Oscillospiraceae bacterium]|nr:class B sortase [Oscillospiraceae bacterium]